MLAAFRDQQVVKEIRHDLCHYFCDVKFVSRNPFSSSFASIITTLVWWRLSTAVDYQFKASFDSMH